MKCFSASKLLKKYSENDISEKQMQILQKHIEHCPNCKKEFFFLRKMSEDLADANDNISLPDDFIPSLMKELGPELSCQSHRSKCSTTPKARIWLSNVLSLVFFVLVLLVVFKYCIHFFYDNDSYTNLFAKPQVFDSMSKTADSFELGIDRFIEQISGFVSNANGFLLALLLLVIAFAFVKSIWLKKTNGNL